MFRFVSKSIESGNIFPDRVGISNLPGEHHYGLDSPAKNQTRGSAGNLLISKSVISVKFALPQTRLGNLEGALLRRTKISIMNCGTISLFNASWLLLFDASRFRERHWVFWIFWHSWVKGRQASVSGPQEEDQIKVEMWRELDERENCRTDNQLFFSGRLLGYGQDWCQIGSPPIVWLPTIQELLILYVSDLNWYIIPKRKVVISKS